VAGHEERKKGKAKVEAKVRNAFVGSGDLGMGLPLWPVSMPIFEDSSRVKTASKQHSEAGYRNCREE